MPLAEDHATCIVKVTSGLHLSASFTGPQVSTHGEHRPERHRDVGARRGLHEQIVLHDADG